MKGLFNQANLVKTMIEESSVRTREGNQKFKVLMTHGKRNSFIFWGSNQKPVKLRKRSYQVGKFQNIKAF